MAASNLFTLSSRIISIIVSYGCRSMERSNTDVVVAVLVAGAMIAGAILLSRSKPLDPPKPDPFQEVKAAVAAKMVDPGSATFQALSERTPDFAYCGEVNAKNRVGGYVGYQKFFAIKRSSGDWLIQLDQKTAEHMCK